MGDGGFAVLAQLQMLYARDDAFAPWGIIVAADELARYLVR